MIPVRLSLAPVALAGLMSIAPWLCCDVLAQTPPPGATPQTARPVVSKPLWQELSKEQQDALEPLHQLWGSMSEPHKRKWLALSRNFHQLSADEKSVLQGRMREWAALTPQQRTLARLNFADVKQLPQDQKRALWDAYQALSPEDKQKLASQQPKPLQSAAPAVKPTPAEKLVLPPSANSQKALPRIDTEQVAPGTLLRLPPPPAPTAASAGPAEAEPTPADAPAAAQ